MFKSFYGDNMNLCKKCIIFIIMLLASVFFSFSYPRYILASDENITPVFRFWSDIYGGHFFTLNSVERDSIISTMPQWSYEGSTWSALIAPDQEALPVFRFWSEQLGAHFFTIHESEKDYIIANLPAWSYEGIAWYSYPVDGPSRQPLFRFWSPVYQSHFYTADPQERDTVLTYSEWSYEGVAWYAPVSDGQGNDAPAAYNLSRAIDVYTPYIEQQTSANDPDGDTLAYELISPPSGTGYTDAYINPSSGILYVTITDVASGTLDLYYRATDGLLFSNYAKVSLAFTYYTDDQNTGKNDVIPEQYAQFQLSTYNSDLLGASGAEPTQPRLVDLSANFPVPGDQGRQSSCVGWATAYALKSYQEKVEMGWALNTSAHLFSPAFVYNQINGGQDQGSYIYQALDLAVNKGIATLNQMPYWDTNYTSQPSSSAVTEAAQFRATNWRRGNDTSQIKAALVNRNPVVGGIKVYQQLMALSGGDSVYNTASGQNLGGHAVTIVGYDDDRYGGAFKVINSWSQNWGDNGFFWMPYNFAAQGILTEAYVLVDAENGQVAPPSPDDRTEPEPNVSTLPNFTVSSWDASYDPRPRGTGTLTYNVVNNGVGIAYAGADINLMLSQNADISASDNYVVYETIPFDLESGSSVYRDSDNSISFQFPDQLQSGVYYMALWVDDLNKVTESNENDNISMGNGEVTITNSLPDLNVNTWYAEWDQYGNGNLTYEVVNNGASGTTTMDWYINLILDPDQAVGNGNEIFLFFEKAGFYLNPGQYIYRDDYSAASFNLYRDYYGHSVPSGTYYVALWVDDLNYEAESNELNNGSYSWGTVSLYGGASATKTEEGAREALRSEAKTNDLNRLHGKAYNGKRLPPADVVMRKVEIARSPSGETTLTYLDLQPMEPQVSEQASPHPKAISSKTSAIFPATRRMAMPGREGLHGK